MNNLNFIVVQACSANLTKCHQRKRSPKEQSWPDKFKITWHWDHSPHVLSLFPEYLRHIVTHASRICWVCPVSTVRSHSGQNFERFQRTIGDLKVNKIEYKKIPELWQSTFDMRLYVQPGRHKFYEKLQHLNCVRLCTEQGIIGNSKSFSFVDGTHGFICSLIN